jgi:hypothetical protein
MVRAGFAFLIGFVALTAVQPAGAQPFTPSGLNAAGTERPARRGVAVPTPPSHFTRRGSDKTPSTAEISPWLYLDRCTGGCTVSGGTTNDAMAGQSDIPMGGSGIYTVTEFANGFGQLGSNGTCMTCPDTTGLNCSTGTPTTTCTADTDCTTVFPAMNAFCDSADADWTMFMTCMTQIESYFALNVTDTIPPGGVAYTEGMIAGLPSDIGLGSDILGIAPILCDAPQDNAISFTFANYHPGYGLPRVLDMCWTAGQETAHVWGLDHEYEFIISVLDGPDGDSACNDPMTYRTDCGGQKFHRDRTAFVGTTGKGEIEVCRPSQNSYEMILAVFGAGTPTVPSPTVSISFPAPATPPTVVTANFAVDAAAGSPRGVYTLELFLNGYNWGSVLGEEFGPDGQQNPSTYTLVAPNAVPQGAIDIVVKALDDVGNTTASSPVTVMYGAACTTDAACAKGQHCNTTTTDNGMAPPGGCYWDAPTGQLGDKCDYPEFCVSGLCQGTAQTQICTQTCLLDTDGSCPSGFVCDPVGNSSDATTGICFTGGGGGGCCSASSGDVAWVQGGLSVLVIGFMFRRRRKA